MTSDFFVQKKLKLIFKKLVITLHVVYYSTCKGGGRNDKNGIKKTKTGIKR